MLLKWSKALINSLYLQTSLTCIYVSAVINTEEFWLLCHGSRQELTLSEFLAQLGCSSARILPHCLALIHFADLTCQQKSSSSGFLHSETATDEPAAACLSPPLAALSDSFEPIQDHMWTWARCCRPRVCFVPRGRDRPGRLANWNVLATHWRLGSSFRAILNRSADCWFHITQGEGKKNQ